MKRLLSKYNNLQNYIIYILPTILYFFNIRNIVFPINYQQDDVRELYISEYLELSCVLDKGDNHPLWTYMIWLLSKISPVELGYLVSSLNIFLLIISMYFVVHFFNEKFDYKVATLISIILVSSPAVLTYSVSLKQYMIELFFSSYCLFVSRNNNSLNRSFNSKSFYIISVLCVLGSLVNAGVFALLVFYFLIKDKLEISNLKYLMVFIVPVILYFERIIDKVTRDGYGSYWENFFITTTTSEGLFTKFIFIFNMMLKSFFGYFYKDQLVYLLVLLIFLSIFYKINENLFPKIVFISFIFLNILKLYPLGTGRTDIVLFPFALVFVAKIASLFLDKLNRVSYFLLISTILIFIFLNVNSFYKQEQIDLALLDIQSAFNEDISIIIAEEQFPSFDYYGRKVFGSKIVDENNCSIIKPNIEYSVVGRRHIVNTEINKEFDYVYKKSEIIILGIELDSRGVFREIEDALFVKGYKLVKSNTYPDGIFLNFYEINN